MIKFLNLLAENIKFSVAYGCILNIADFGCRLKRQIYKGYEKCRKILIAMIIQNV